MFKWECRDDSSEDENYILPDLCKPATETAADSLSVKSEKPYNETYEKFFKSECREDSSEYDNYVLPDLCKATTEAAQDSLPEKSKKLYKETYAQFLKWMEEKETKLCSEILLLDYFKELSTKMSPVSLWPKYSMLRAMINQEKNIDIKSYTQLRTFLKKLNTGVRCKRAKTFTSKEMEKFLTEAPDEEYLDLKVVMIIGVIGGCRRKELHDLKMNQVKDEKSHLIINLQNTNTHVTRSFTVNNPLREIVIKYMKLRPNYVGSNNFFLNYQKGRCTKQLIGINKIGGMPQRIATWLKLPSPNLYTGHSFRNTSASLLADAGTSTDPLKHHSGWHLNEIAEGNVEQSVVNKGDISSQIIEESVDETSCDSSEAVEDSLPEKSKKLYKEAYVQFTKWMEEKETKSCNEIVLLDYFKELSTKMSPVSLWPKYSMLRAMINQEKNIDIRNYTQLRTFLKNLNTGVSCKKAKTFTSQEMEKFLIEAPDEQYLDLKVVMIIGVTGACRRKELHDLRITDVKDEKNHLIITMPDTVTLIIRTFTVNNSLREIVIKYMNLRPKDIEDNHFFLNYQKGKCTKQLIGINKIGGMPQRIAKWLNLPFPNLYTGHSFRRTSASLLADAGASLDTLKCHGGWRSNKMAESYIEQSVINKRKICNEFIEGLVNETSCDSTVAESVEDPLPKKSKKFYRET